MLQKQAFGKITCNSMSLCQVFIKSIFRLLCTDFETVRKGAFPKLLEACWQSRVFLSMSTVPRTLDSRSTLSTEGYCRLKILRTRFGFIFICLCLFYIVNLVSCLAELLSERSWVGCCITLLKLINL